MSEIALSAAAADLCLDRLRVLAKTLSLQIALGSTTQPLPDLSDFFPATPEQAEIQQFNLSLTIPTRFHGREEDTAMWVLEKDSLDRQQVANFVSDQSNPFPRAVLQKIASQIASIDAGHGFADGLKFLLPVVGLWERCSSDHADYDEAALRYVLTAYCQAHIQHSKKPLLPSLTLESLADLTEVALTVTELLRMLAGNKKPQAQAMTDFFTSLRGALRHSTSVNMSIRAMTDLFIAASSTLAQSITVSPTLPSYLFASTKLTGVVSLAFSFRDSRSPYFARVGRDAIYFFHLHGLCGELYAAIPLWALHTQRCSNNGNLDLLELLDYGGGKVPFITFARHECEGGDGRSYQCHVPVEVAFHQRVLLEIDPKRNRIDPHMADATSHHPMHRHANGTAHTATGGVSIFEDDDLRYVEDWVDVLETCAWECRAARRLSGTVTVSVAPSQPAAPAAAATETAATAAGSASAVDPISML